MNTDFEILPITQAIISFALAYLIGSIPMGFIVARIAAGMDIREHGSGNIGLTNVIRTLGWGPGIITGVLDFLKGYIPVILVITSFSPRDFGSVAAIYELIVIIASLLLILGNLFPVYLLFKGGKGVATGLGVLSALMGVYVFIPLAVFGIFIGFFRFVSIASMAAALSAPLAVVFLKPYITFTQESTSAFIILLVFTSAVALLVIWRHRSNLIRLSKGTEPRIGDGKSKPAREEKIIISAEGNGKSSPGIEAERTDEVEESV